MAIVTILFLADTHLGFDFPFKPRIDRRRRGPDFFRNFEQALLPAMRDEVDCVIHGGDLLYRSRVPAALVDMAMAPLRQIADRGIPVFVVPGNHERSRIPHGLLAEYPNIHIFRSPSTLLLRVRDATIALAGFPNVRHEVRSHFSEMLEQTHWRDSLTSAQGIVLCMHQCVEGAQVGVHNYTFRYNTDVVRTVEIPPTFTAVLSGHIHRYQVLRTDLQKNPLRCPILYPGSIERTSIAERNEVKGYIILELEVNHVKPAAIRRIIFQRLPTRPMDQIQLNLRTSEGQYLLEHLREVLGSLHTDSVVQIKVNGRLDKEQRALLSAPVLRSIAPGTMNVYVSWPLSAASGD
jgi:DNA repair exonuclease SbcCD nuclease subunit